MAAKAAPSALVEATRAADGGCGAGNGDPPFALQGGHRERRPTGTEAWHQLGTSTEVGPAEHFELSSDDGRPHRGGAASGTVGALAAGGAAAARRHRARDCPESRRSCAADGGTVAGCSPFLRHVSASGCRAGYRSAEDLASRCSSATFVSRHAAGGTAGGSAADRILFLVTADCGAPRRHSSSWS